MAYHPEVADLVARSKGSIGKGIIVFAFLFAWTMCWIAKVDSEITEALENKAWWEGKESETWKH